VASFGLCCAVQPLLHPLSGSWPGSPQAGFAQPSQAAQGAPRAPGATCCISAENCFFECASRGRGREQDLALFVCCGVRRTGFPGADSSCRADSPAAGGSPSKSSSGCGLAAESRRLGPRSRRLLDLGPGFGAQQGRTARGVRGLSPEGTQVSRQRADWAEIRSSHTLPPRDTGGERGDGGGRTDPGRGRRKH
jgi:hypothetical protein